MEHLLFVTFGGSVLALLLLTIKALLRSKLPNTVYYYAWLLVLLRFALPLPGLVPTGAEAEPIQTAVSDTMLRERDESTILYPPLETTAPKTSVTPVNVQPQTSETEDNVSLTTPVVSTLKRSIGWRSPVLWLSLWAGGTLISLAFYVGSYWQFTRRISRTLKRADAIDRQVYAAIPGRKPRLYRCPDTRTPLMCGVLHPRIILPDRVYDEETLSNILRHELTHYRRFDTLYKWVAVAVLSTQWFNPLSYLIRREINRACELSCDEMLLRSMNRAEKQSYGNTLLAMAASSALPAGVVATTFATEKRNLKERLEQIMHYKKSGARLLASILTLALLAGCGVAAGPQTAATVTPVAEGADSVVHVETVDELLAAIAPDTTIDLGVGTYDLSTAANYGEDSGSEYYRWNQAYDGYELEIHDVENLVLHGAGMDHSTIAAVPRYANVLKFYNCKNITLDKLTAGHTQEPGFCAGGVLRFDASSNINISLCGMFGCGTIGVWAQDCAGLNVSASNIYECSTAAVSLHSCREVTVDDCEVFNNGTKAGQSSAMSLFQFTGCNSVAVTNSRIVKNAFQNLLASDYSKDVIFLSNSVPANTVYTSMFTLSQYPITVDGCVFADNESVFSWYNSAGIYAYDLDGNALDSDALAAMSFRDLDASAVKPAAEAKPAAEVRPGESITVTSVDEFLAAIGPDRTIVLDGELFDLSTASDYGSIGGEYYFWQEDYDGPELIIQNVSGLTIHPAASNPEATTLAAIPRYANVLSFRNCDDIQLIGFTLGHTKEPGSCSGGVLNFQNCNGIWIDGCRLYGCGILGIQTFQCSSVDLLRTEIYECSQGAGSFFQTDGIRFVDCNIHDVPSPALYFSECGDKSWNSEPIDGFSSMFDVDADGNLAEIKYDEEPRPFDFLISDLVNPFGEEPETPFEAGSPLLAFSQKAQTAFVDQDWETFADMLNYPLELFTSERNFLINTHDEFLASVQNENFMHNFYTDDFVAAVADDPLESWGQSVFGITICGHRFAFTCFGNEVREDNLFITAISIDDPLYPGRLDDTVPPTPQP